MAQIRKLFSREWHALGREAELAGEQLAYGVTSLRRATFSQKGYYTQAFFGLASGIERVAKLIVIADFAIEHGGQFPSNKILKKFSHNLESLIEKCDEIASHRCQNLGPRPAKDIHDGIVRTLSEYGQLSRYYNLDLLTTGSPSFSEPIRSWWQRVALPVLQKHYSVRMRERDEAIAAALGAEMDEMTSVIFHDEREDPIDSMGLLLSRAAATRVVQRFGLRYTLDILRWLARLLQCVVASAVEAGLVMFYGTDEWFMIFRADERFTRNRKSFSIYRH